MVPDLATSDRPSRTIAKGEESVRELMIFVRTNPRRDPRPIPRSGDLDTAYFEADGPSDFADRHPTLGCIPSGPPDHGRRSADTPNSRRTSRRGASPRALRASQKLLA